jgi:hypothetical protein
MDQAAQQFRRHLRELHLRAGKPSYATLERFSQHKLKRATVSDVLNGNRVNLPDWRFVALFVEACRAAAMDSGLTDSHLGTLADWKRHWDSASSGIIGARYPGSGQQHMAARDPDVATGTATRDLAASTGGADGRGSANGAAAAAQDTAIAAVRTADSGTDGDEGAGSAAGQGSSERTSPAPATMWGLVPGPLPGFIGREGWLSALRAKLTAPDAASPVVIQGQFGIGKSQLALEYLHRYSSEYDLIWWISCATPEAVQAALAALAAGLGVAEGTERQGSQHSQLYDALRTGQPRARWLLVFDGAEDPAEIRNLVPPVIPPATGHVLVTTRNSRWEASGDMLELDPFTREESVRFLRREMRRVSAADAHRLAEAVGDLPLLLEHVVEAQIDATEYIARLNTDPFGLFDTQPVDYPTTVLAQWRAVLGQLRENYPDSLDLLRCLAFFGPEAVSRDWIERGRYLAEISISECLGDPLRLNGAMRALRRTGLLRIRPGARALEIHEVTRCVLRKMASKHEAQRARHDVHLLLVAADPRDPSDPANWRRYDELRSHAAHARIESCDEGSVRDLVINMVRSLTAAGSPKAAVSQADRTLRRWSAIEIKDEAARSRALLAMRLAKADALLACGQYQASFQLQQETLTAMRSDPGGWVEEISHLNSMTGVRHRVLGDFPDARAADRQSVDEHVERLGYEHPQTFLAINNVITDLALSGDYPAAAQEAMRVYGQCLEFHDDPRYPAVLLQQNALGRCQWLCGMNQEASFTLAQVRAGYDEKIAAGEFSENHPWRLASEIDYAVAQRDSGGPPAEAQVLARHLQVIRRRCHRALGAEHPQTLAATVALASVLRRIAGQEGEAVHWLAEADRLYRSSLPEHPFAFACTGYLATVRQSLPDGGSPAGLALAADELQDVIAGLTQALSADHPLTLAAVSGLANAQAAAGNLDAALYRAEQALRGFQDRLGTAHPHKLACEANVATIQAHLGQDPSSGELRERYAAILGAGHTDVKLFTEQRLISIDFTPLPL